MIFYEVQAIIDARGLGSNSTKHMKELYPFPHRGQHFHVFVHQQKKKRQTISKCFKAKSYYFENFSSKFKYCLMAEEKTEF